MASKKKRTGRGKLRCLSCDQKLKRSWGGCPRCGRPRLARDATGKAVGTAAFIAKGAAVRCSACGGSSRPGASYCTRCGRPAVTVVKNAAPSERDYFLAKVRGEADPTIRQGWWERLQRSYGPGGAA